MSTNCGRTELNTRLKRLTHLQRRFLAELPFSSSDAEAAKRAGVHKATVCEWKRDPFFMEAYEKTWEADIEMRRQRLVEGLAKAVETLLALLNSRNPNVRLKAATEILDRAGLIRAERVEHGVSPALQQLLEEAERARGEEG